MNTATIKRLNQINRDFYALTADSFDESRGRAWPGWKRLLPELTDLNNQHQPISVLDVGCGNGRLGLFLLRHVSPEVRYHGIDNSPILLEHGRSAIAEEFPAADVQFEERDIVDNLPETGIYDLVTLFGVIHHIPGSQQRRTLLDTLARRVAPGGLLIFTCWRFYEYERFREHIVPWSAELSTEPNDYLLEWRRGLPALRYCHYVDNTENADLVAASKLSEIGTFRADGHTNDINRYTILRRDGS